ncbi:UNVERIFIED_CONTAM: hypothetical protein Scaly_0103400 [Sesamum calycinum]|uniref:Uncharacterized protein n=1 Tax=Sesamum calycinum TaxID=2727403 RepID=A0AAW2SVS5_9LAMI
MSLALQAIFTNKNPTSSPASLSPTRLLKSVNLSFSARESRTHFPNHRFLTSQCHVFSITKIKASLNEPYGTSRSQANGGGSTLNHFSFDAFLSTIEFFSLASSAAISVYVALRSGLQQGGVLGRVGSNILVWQCVVCGSVSYGVNLLGRVEKLEEDLRSSATIIRVLSRQLEKLGIRTAALAQKNSEATRALAVQEDILEKELGEIQKVLLAMQEQQQKQLELILAIGKAGKLWETKRLQAKDQNVSETSKPAVDGLPHLETNQVEVPALQRQANNKTS